MIDPRMTKLAKVLVEHSCRVTAGDKVLIEAVDIPHNFTCELIRVIKEAGGLPFLKLESNTTKRAQMLHGSEEYWDIVADQEAHLMKKMQCYIGIRGSHNVSELSDVSANKQKIYEDRIWERVHHAIRVPKTRWVVLRWPYPGMAQLAGMSTEAFENFYFDVCTLDYGRLEEAMQPLKALMEKTEQVHIKGPGKTDLHFSIKDIPVRHCAGYRNIPDGEVFTAPVRDSVQGVIEYNTPTIYRGETHERICLRFKDGKIIEASSTNTKRLNEVLDSDEGARYIGEFAIGFNPYCTRAMKDILFDEKMAGSIHFTPGASYKDAYNGNDSAIHWDMVLQQTEELGGGEIYFDGELIRKDGLFVVDSLKGLNPDQLIGDKRSMAHA